MKWSLEARWLAGGFGLSMLLTGGLNILANQNVMQLVESSDQVEQSYEIGSLLIDIRATLVEAEAGRRGYLLSGSQAELTRHYQAVQQIEPQLGELQQNIVADPVQQRYLKTLRTLIAKRLELSRRSIAIYRTQSSLSKQIPLVIQSIRHRGEIRQTLAKMRSRESQLLRQWIAHSQAQIRDHTGIELLSLILTFGILLVVYILLYQQMIRRRKAEEGQQVLQQQQELSQLKLNFFSMISHEFRTPLSVISASAQLMGESDRQWAEKNRLKNLHRIQSSANLMTQLLSDLLTLTRAEAGRLTYNPAWMDIESFCLNLIEDLQIGNAEQHHIQFSKQGACTRVMGDEKLLHSILTNLLSNAIKYSPDGGTVGFKLICTPELICFEIKDEGVGIPPEDLRSLYHPFHRSRNVDNIAGSGLGLAVVKKCIDLHGGTIDVQSEVGVGTAFTVSIPKTQELP